jgi:exonuclease VII small subunit
MSGRDVQKPRIGLGDLSKNDLLYPLLNPQLRSIYEGAVKQLLGRGYNISNALFLENAFKIALSKARKAMPNAILTEFSKLWLEEVVKPEVAVCFSQRKLSEECREKFKSVALRVVAKLRARELEHEEGSERRVNLVESLANRFYALITLTHEAAEGEVVKIIQGMCSDIEEKGDLEIGESCREALKQAQKRIEVIKLVRKSGITGKLTAELIREDRESR